MSPPPRQVSRVAIATVRGVEGVCVMRAEVGPGDDEPWMSSVVVQGRSWHTDDKVTVTSRAVVVTEQDVAWFRDLLEVHAGDVVFQLARFEDWLAEKGLGR